MECLSWVSWPKVEPQSLRFVIALSFVDALPPEEATHYLRERVTQIEGAIRRLDRRAEERMRGEEEGRRSVTGALFEHQRTHLEAEPNCLSGLLDRLEHGR